MTTTGSHKQPINKEQEIQCRCLHVDMRFYVCLCIYTPLCLYACLCRHVVHQLVLFTCMYIKLCCTPRYVPPFFIVHVSFATWSKWLSYVTPFTPHCKPQAWSKWLSCDWLIETLFTNPFTPHNKPLHTPVHPPLCPCLIVFTSHYMLFHIVTTPIQTLSGPPSLPRCYSQYFHLQILLWRCFWSAINIGKHYINHIIKHFKAESTEASWIKCLAQGQNMLMQSMNEPGPWDWKHTILWPICSSNVMVCVEVPFCKVTFKCGRNHHH